VPRAAATSGMAPLRPQKHCLDVRVGFIPGEIGARLRKSETPWSLLHQIICRIHFPVLSGPQHLLVPALWLIWKNRIRF